MYALIKNNEIVGFTDYAPSEENMQFDEVIEGNFDFQKQYVFQNGSIEEIKNEPVNIAKEELYRLAFENIKRTFDIQVETFLSKYPKYEIQTFETKRKEAEKFLSGETSTYLEGLLEKKNEVLLANGKNPLSISDFANIILLKADEYAEMYFTLEAWKDAEIKKIKALYT